MITKSFANYNNKLRPICLTRGWLNNAEGSVLIEFGQTRVLVVATVLSQVPKWLYGKDQGWLSAEYAMLPRSTGQRTQRESLRGKPSGRTLEISRLIGRSLRAAINLKQLNGYTITLDCDVLQADGGTRTASITGAWIAVYDAVEWIINHKKATFRTPDEVLLGQVSAVSVGIVDGSYHLDLDYQKDSRAEVDMNIVMLNATEYVEIQGTGEHATFTHKDLDCLLELGKNGNEYLVQVQKEAISSPKGMRLAFD